MYDEFITLLKKCFEMSQTPEEVFSNAQILSRGTQAQRLVAAIQNHYQRVQQWDIAVILAGIEYNMAAIAALGSPMKTVFENQRYEDMVKLLDDFGNRDHVIHLIYSQKEKQAIRAQQIALIAASAFSVIALALIAMFSPEIYQRIIETPFHMSLAVASLGVLNLAFSYGISQVLIQRIPATVDILRQDCHAHK